MSFLRQNSAPQNQRREIAASALLTCFVLAQIVLPASLTIQSAQANERRTQQKNTLPTKSDGTAAQRQQETLATQRPPRWFQASGNKEAMRRRAVAEEVKTLLAQGPRRALPGVTMVKPAIVGRRSMPGEIRPSASLYTPKLATTLQGLNLSEDYVPTQAEVTSQGSACGPLAPAGEAEPAKVEEEVEAELKKNGFRQGLKTVLPPSEMLVLNAPLHAAAVYLEAGQEKVKKARDQNREFALAIEDWNAERFNKSVKALEEYTQKFPESPWVPEALIHIADYAKFMQQPARAQDLYQRVMEATSENVADMSYEAHQKAYERWADLYLTEGRLAEARPMLEDLANNDASWRRRTWGTYWLRELNIIQNDRKRLLAMRDCGSKALAMVFNDLGQNKAARRVSNLTPNSEAGFSLAQLREIAGRQGLPLVGFRARTEQLARLPLPLILHYAPLVNASSRRSAKIGTTMAPGSRDSIGMARVSADEVARSGHFMVMRSIDSKRGIATLINPQDGARSTITLKQLSKEWSGNGLMLVAAKSSKGTGALKQLPERAPKVRWLLASAPKNTASAMGAQTTGTPTMMGKAVSPASKGLRVSLSGVSFLSDTQMRRVRGTCYMVSPQKGIGENGANEVVCATCPENRGAPGVMINTLTRNVYINDIPLWYSPAKGPEVQISISYNSLEAANFFSLTGNKWAVGYSSHIVETPGGGGSDGRVTLFCPDGKQLSFTPDPAIPDVGYTRYYTSQRGVFDNLKRTADKTFTLTSQSGDKTFYGVPAGTSSTVPLIVRQEDRFGQALTFTWTVKNTKIVLDYILDASGRKTRFFYDSNGRVAYVQDPSERQASFKYDGNGNLVECIDMEGNAFGYSYDASANVTEMNTAQGPWNFSYLDHVNSPDGHEDNVVVTNPLSQQRKFAWVGHNVANTDYRGNVTLITSINLVGSQTNSVGVDGTSAIASVSTMGEVTYYNYAPETPPSNAAKTLSPTSIVDARGKTTSFSYNSQGMVTSITDPKINVTTINYAANGIDVASVYNANNVAVVSASSYNAYHQPGSVTAYSNGGVTNTTTMTYTSWGAPDLVTDSQGHQTDYIYGTANDNNKDRLVQVKRDNVTMASFTYDEMGRVATATDEANLTVGYQYNNLDAVTKVTYPDGTFSQTVYTCCTLPGMTIDRAGRKTYFDYDNMRRLVRVQDANGDTLQKDYDRDGNLIRLMDAKANITVWSYDALDRVMAKTYNDGTGNNGAGVSETYTYANGVLTQSVGANGKRINYSYDNNGNVTLVDYLNLPDVTISYNKLDDVTSVSDSVGTEPHTFDYDYYGRLNGLSGPLAGDDQSFSYDQYQRLIGQSVGRGDSAGNQSQLYTYDTLERLKTVNSNGTNGAGIFTYNYVGQTGLLDYMDLPNGMRVDNSYDSLQRLTVVDNKSITGTFYLSKYTYSYDNRDVRTGMTSKFGNEASTVVDYTYDSVDQLITENVTSRPFGGPFSNSFDYDSMGNRTSTSYFNGSQSVGTTYGSNALNQLTSVTNASSGTSNYSYDNAGNTVQVSNSTAQLKTLYTYDDLDRLIRIETRSLTDAPFKKSEFSYDVFSRKVISREFTWNSPSWTQTSETRRVFNGLDVIQERNADNTTRAQLVRDGNIGGILARYSTANGQSYFHYDGSGNVTGLTDASGVSVGRYSYSAYGSTLEATGTRAAENPYRYSTKELHTESGMYDYGYRFYNPATGRWLNRDPIEESGGVNLYGFVGNDPINSLDAYGLENLIDVIKELPRAFVQTIGMWPDEEALDSANAPRTHISGAMDGDRDIADDLIDDYQNRTKVGLVCAANGVVNGIQLETAVVSEGVTAARLAAKLGAVYKTFRIGKEFTKTAKQSVVNAAREASEDGILRCNGCNVEVIAAQKSKSGVTPAANEIQVDHIHARSRGGSGLAQNGQVLCRACNRAKSNH